MIAEYFSPCIARANFSSPCKYLLLSIKSLFLLFATQETEATDSELILFNNSSILLFFKFSNFIPGNCPCIDFPKTSNGVAGLLFSIKVLTPK